MMPKVDWETTIQRGVTRAEAIRKGCKLNVAGWRTHGYTATVNNVYIGANTPDVFKTIALAKKACVLDADRIYAKKQEAGDAT